MEDEREYADQPQVPNQAMGYQQNPYQGEANQNAPGYAPNQPQAYQQAGYQQQPYQQPYMAPQPGRKGPSPVLIAAIAGIAIGVVAVVVMLFVLPNLGGERRYQIQAQVSAPGLDADGSRIPVHVQGTTRRGVSIDEHTYVDYLGAGLELPAGEYEATLDASPIAADGTIYEYRTVLVTIYVPEGGPGASEGDQQSGGDTDGDPGDSMGGDTGGGTGPSFVVTPIGPGDADPGDLQNAREWMGRDPSIGTADKDRLGDAAQEKNDQGSGDQGDAASQEEANIAAAKEFAAHFYSNYYRPDGTGALPAEITLEEWKSNCLPYVAPGSDLEYVIQNAAESYFDGTGNYVPTPYPCDAGTYTHDVEVRGTSDNVVYLTINEVGTQQTWDWVIETYGPDPEPNTSYDVTVEFDADGKVIRVGTEWGTWPEVYWER